MLINKNSVSIEYKNLYSLQRGKIVIPVFQRFYSWKIEQISQIKDDLFNLFEDQTKQLYLFDFIYYEEEGKIKLADGQQRLVTINNLIKAINDISAEKNIEIEELPLFDISYEIEENNEKYKKHFHGGELRAPFKKIYFEMKNFVEINIQKINELVNIIKNNIFIYMKKCSGLSDAFEIFQQVNTGGKPLTRDEIINTVLTQNAKIYGIQYNVPKRKEIIPQITSYHKFQVENVKKLDLGEIMSFLRQYIVKDKESFLKFIKITKKLDKIKDKPIKSVISYINRQTIMEVVNILEIKNIFNNDYMHLVILPMCMMSVVLTLNGGSPTTFSYLLNDVIKKIKADKKLADIERFLYEEVEKNFSWKIEYDDFKNKLGDKNTAINIKKALLVMDVIINNKSGEMNMNSVNLEHIFPKHPDNSWYREGKNWPASGEEHERLVDNIGNCFLLNEKVNKKIQNSYIKYKISEYNEIIEKDCFLQTPLNKVDFNQFENDGPDYIKKRQGEMAKYICENFFPGLKLIIRND